jgi:HlyD family secretion protein
MAKITVDAQTARREHILDSAERCFAERGFHSTSMHDICRAAAISPGALYTYFASKEQLIAGLCDREKTKLVEALAVVGEAKDFMAALSALGETYCVHQPIEKLRLHVEINAEALRNPAIGEIVRSIDTFVLSSFERLLERAREEGRINPSLDKVALAQVMSVIGDGICWQRAMNPDFDASAVMPVIMGLLSTLIQPAEDRPEAEKRANARAAGWTGKMKAGAAILAVLLAAGAMTAPLGARAADAPPPAAATEGPAVSVVAVAKDAFVQNVLVTGSLIARLEVLVSPQIDGYRITELLVDEGERVTEGQVLARLDRSRLDAQLAQLEAQRTRADAAIAQARSTIAQAQATQKQAEAAFERARDLVKTGATSQATFDEREAAARTAAAAFAAASDGLRVSEADKTAIEAQIREAQLKVGYTEIRAPVEGVISRRSVRLGQVALATVGDPLFRIIAKGEVEMAAEVPEIYLPKMKQGMPARIEVAGLPERKGTIRLISPEVEQSTRLGRVRIFIGDDSELRIGTFARAVIEVAKSDGLGVPSSAILNQNDSQTVQVVKDGKVESRAVRTGLVSHGNTEIVDGLAEGELVVLRSGTLLRDGDAVRPVMAAKLDKTASSEAR